MPNSPPSRLWSLSSHAAYRSRVLTAQALGLFIGISPLLSGLALVMTSIACRSVSDSVACA